jgi:hypothetical protein
MLTSLIQSVLGPLLQYIVQQVFSQLTDIKKVEVKETKLYALAPKIPDAPVRPSDLLGGDLVV